jgi:two-component system, chemotaxis family, response regulator Rcp1
VIKLEILLIEDHPGDVLLIQTAISHLELPCRLHVAPNGRAALDFLSSDYGSPASPDLILLDLNLPGLNSHQVLERLKENPQTRHLPVLVLSSSGSPSDIQRSYQHHANGYISKPRSLGDLYRMMDVIQSFWTLVRLPQKKQQSFPSRS